jgi:hypothetical protein
MREAQRIRDAAVELRQLRAVLGAGGGMTAEPVPRPRGGGAG